MKKIGIDARLYNQTGVGVYLRNLLCYLELTIQEDWKIYVYLIKKDYERVSFSHKNFIKRIADYRWHSFSEQINFLSILNQDKLDLMHFTYFSYPILYNKKFISTIHDLTPLLFKTGKSSTKNPIVYSIKHYFLKLVLSQQIKNSQIIITPTNSVKNQLVKYYGFNINNKIKTIYEGINKEMINVKENYSLGKEFGDKFFIYVGNFYPHKNIVNLVKAFSKIKNEYRLILLGPDDYFSKQIVQLINQLNMNKKIILFNNARINDLIYFYKHAQALIHPSISEGFGLPIVEAMHFNLPIIASNIDVFKEILDKQYVSFDPMNVNDIKDKIQNFIDKPINFNYTKLIIRYSFSNMTNEIVNIYRSILC